MVFYLISGPDSTMSLSGFLTVTHLPTADIQSQTYKQRARVIITLSLDISYYNLLLNSYALTTDGLSMDNIAEGTFILLPSANVTPVYFLYNLWT